MTQPSAVTLLFRVPLTLHSSTISGRVVRQMSAASCGLSCFDAIEYEYNFEGRGAPRRGSLFYLNTYR
jgi:hypothetical protein